MKEGQITNGILVANECVDYWRKSRTPGLICKIDLKKAFDKVNWNFLEWVLSKKGFGSRWIKWIMGCVRCLWFSIILNSTSKGFFYTSKELRQGNPLSPFLFSLVADSLSALLSHTFRANLNEEFKIPSYKLSISHLQFANDTIIFVKPSSTNINNLKFTLQIF